MSFTVKGDKLVPDDATKTLLVLQQVPSQGNVDYITVIDLPIGVEAIKGYPVQLTAFIDLNDDNQPGATEPKNQTIDRLYTGFINLYKESRILDVNKLPLTGADGQFSAKSKIAQSGEYLEYRITFKNDAVGSPNSIGIAPLNALNFKVTDDGSESPNNWATLTENDPGSTKIDLGSIDPQPAADNLTVTKYINDVGTLAPQKSGTLRFIRKVK